QQATVQELVSELPARRDEPVELAVLKGDARLADVLRRAVHAHIAKPAADVVPIIGNRRHRIPVERARRYVDDARRAMLSGELRWDSGRERLRQLLAQDVRRQREDAGGAPSDAETAKVARSAQVKDFVDSMWPALDPATVLVRLFTDAGLRERCGRSLFSAEELAALGWAEQP